jgi:hypothetical protein
MSVVEEERFAIANNAMASTWAPFSPANRLYRIAPKAYARGYSGFAGTPLRRWSPRCRNRGRLMVTRLSFKQEPGIRFSTGVP